MIISLYQAAQNIQQKIYLCVDEETGELDMDKLNEIECSFIDRAVATTAVIKTFEINAIGLQAQKTAVMAEFDKRINQAQTQSERLRENLHLAMKATSTTHIKSDDGMLEAKLYIDRDESIELEKDAVFDESLLNPQKPAPERTPSKKLIKEAILRGEPIKGARIVKHDRLEIK